MLCANDPTHICRSSVCLTSKVRQMLVTRPFAHLLVCASLALTFSSLTGIRACWIDWVGPFLY